MLTLVAGFSMNGIVAEFEVAQVPEMTEQTAILEPIQDKTYVESNQRFIRQKHAETDKRGEVEMEAEVVMELELRQPPMYWSLKWR
ncbi:putative LRR receptor-like serine/threonine-protein kinase [Hordeum vulgare]|nr:putative LRR receptor-like serine/threonine-protein kinase [Hordeum vulgare]